MKKQKTITLTFTEQEIEWTIAAFRDAQMALCGLDGEPRPETMGDFKWREAMETALVGELNKLKNSEKA